MCVYMCLQVTVVEAEVENEGDADYQASSDLSVGLQSTVRGVSEGGWSEAARSEVTDAEHGSPFKKVMVKDKGGVTACLLHAGAMHAQLNVAHCRASILGLRCNQCHKHIGTQYGHHALSKPCACLHSTVNHTTDAMMSLPCVCSC